MAVSASGNDRSRPVSLWAIAAAMVILTASVATSAVAASSESANDTTDARKPKLKSIALSPLTFAGLPGATQQLTVSGTYSDGAVKTLKPATEKFSSSNTAVATVSSAGVVSVAAGAVAGATATIGALNKASGISTTAASSTVVTVLAPKLVSIALSPLGVQLAPNATPQQLTVTGTYSNGSTQTLPAAGESFSSSKLTIATVSPGGLVTVVSGALVGGTSTIGVTDVATGISASPSQSTVVTATLPSSNSVNAATQTANDNALCTAISPFYWEIGDQNDPLASGSVGLDNGAPISGSTQYSIASASKMLYGAYVTQVRGAASNLTPSDITFLTLTSGYANIPDTTTEASICPQTDHPDDVAQCLLLTSPLSQFPNEPFGYQIASEVGEFYYNSGHMEVHANQPSMAPLGTTPVAAIGSPNSLGSLFVAELGTDMDMAPLEPFNYTEPLIAGGVTTTGDVYAEVLRSILSGSLAFGDALGIDPVCTLSTMPDCTNTAGYTPFPLEAWHYSIGHWVEDATGEDGAFSSAGEFGFYPWIDSTKSYYGIVSHNAANSAYPSIECGRLIRAAFMTGTPQTEKIPTEVARQSKQH